MKKIYVYSPTDIVSGGVNSLHLLCKALINNGFDACMYYDADLQQSFLNNPIIKSFDVPYSLNIEDNENTLLIAPEAKIFILYQFEKIYRMVYWLGIYFYFKTPPHRFPLNFKPFRRLFYCSDYFGISSNWYHTLAKRMNYWNKKNDPIWTDGTLHMSNSHYAAAFIKSMGVRNVFVLHNPVRDEFYEQEKNTNKSKMVLYGPKTPKGLINSISKQHKDFTFVRMKRLSPQEIVDLYKKAVLFIELGNFAGRDRMPREAVLSGCVILTSKIGSASYYDDMQIPDYYKLNVYKNYKKELTEKVSDILNNYEKHYESMSEYVNYLKSEKNNFHAISKSIFKGIIN